jgi:hypothetical protein
MNYGIGAALFAGFSFSGFAEICINEFMASNVRAYPDITDFEDYPDWIELHNTGAEVHSLRGIHLSDDPDDPLKWGFPFDASIPAGGFLVVIADGHDTNAGVELRRTNFRSSRFVTEKYHTNFSLSSTGETILLTEVGREDTALVSSGEGWKFLDDGSNPGVLWREKEFDDSAWSGGASPLGYGDPVTTEVSYGAVEDDRQITSYFRKAFNLVGIGDVDELILGLIVDDGAVVYLNGTEVVRKNLPTGSVTSLTQALSDVPQEKEGLAESFLLPLSLLVEGENVLAVEVHQVDGLSEDMRFDLTLTSSRVLDSELRETVTYPQQVADVSMGRDEHDSNLWVNFVESTPGVANTGPLVSDLRQTSEEVEFSLPGGLVDGPVMLQLSVAEGEVYYSLDGSNPSPSSLTSILYGDPFELTETTVVRARCFSIGKIAGPIVTRSYFMGEEFSGLPYVSLVADPETLFGDDIGIYYNTHEEFSVIDVGPAVYKGKDAPGHLEFFPEDGGMGFGVNGGIRMGGENNWATHLQRAINFTLRGRYGDDAIDYDLFPGSGIPRFTALTMREGGDDWGKSHMTDALWDSIARGRMEVETNRSRPAAFFINGEYWGLFNLRDRWNDDWFFQHYGTNDGEYERILLGGGDNTVASGTGEDYLNLTSFLNEGNFDNPEEWSELESRVDIVSAVDFVIAEGYGRNWGWGGNREIWLDYRPGSKWRFFIPDMDKTFGSGLNMTIMDQMMSGDQIIRRIRNSANFQRLLAQRAAVQLVTTFDEGRIHGLIDSYSDLMSPELPRQRSRWGGVPSEEDYHSSIQRMKDFVTARKSDFLGEVASVLGNDPAVSLTLIAEGSGSFEIEGVPFDDESLQVFPNLGLNLKAVPAPGYRFDGWVGGENEAELQITLSGPETLTAKFVLSGGMPIGGILAGISRFTSEESPYFVTSNLEVPEGGTLTIEEGVSLILSRGIQIRVQGTLNVEGSENAPVSLAGRNGELWGGISFEQTSTTSTLSHLRVRNSGRGFDPVNYPAGISGLDSNVVIEFLNIDEGLAPLFFRGGSLILRDSFVRIPITGDGLNVKQGQAQTLRCVFQGNSAPDTDAIDYDGVVNGLIKDCQIYRFFGFNSDGIDIGEHCVDVLIEGNQIYFNSDKGISVGQGSTVISKNNLIVGCPLGVGVKDFGSTITVDQNTFVDCGIGVSVYEKNFGAGGGEAIISNSIFSKSSQSVSKDPLSSFSVTFSMSDTDQLPGENNILGSPGFVDPTKLDFSLREDSLARDSGDPAHLPDPDATQADRGAYYFFDPTHYPFLNGNTVVINEVLANSGANEADWMELHNRSEEIVDVSGWYLSDDGGFLAKYRIPEGTILPAGGYLAFYEDIHFGLESSDPGRVEPFSLSDTGESVYLTSASGGVLTDYRHKRKFDASMEGVSLGYYYKPSTDTYNFVAQKEATPARENGEPAVGPIVISEIMYQPESGASEYLELLNISDAPVRMYDVETGARWRISDGVSYAFHSNVILEPGERLLLVENISALGSYNINPWRWIYQWTSGRLNNGGETIQLVRPGPLMESGGRSAVRVDRVNYNNNAPWPVAASGGGVALRKISEKLYGNDFANWAASAPSPKAVTGAGSFSQWASDRGGLSIGGDPDGDGLLNLIEYALGRDPLLADIIPPFDFLNDRTSIHLGLGIPLVASDVDLVIERSLDMESWSTVSPVPTTVTDQLQWSEISLPLEQRGFFRLKAILKQ